VWLGLCRAPQQLIVKLAGATAAGFLLYVMRTVMAAAKRVVSRQERARLTIASVGAFD